MDFFSGKLSQNFASFWTRYPSSVLFDLKFLAEAGWGVVVVEVVVVIIIVVVVAK